jgi:hypothetical protein
MYPPARSYHYYDPRNFIDYFDEQQQQVDLLIETLQDDQK